MEEIRIQRKMINYLNYASFYIWYLSLFSIKLYLRFGFSRLERKTLIAENDFRRKQRDHWILEGETEKPKQTAKSFCYDQKKIT